jgi:hypothetical protein
MRPSWHEGACIRVRTVQRRGCVCEYDAAVDIHSRWYNRVAAVDGLHCVLMHVLELSALCTVGMEMTVFYGLWHMWYVWNVGINSFCCSILLCWLSWIAQLLRNT